MYETLESPKIINKVSCEKNQIIDMDNIKCEIIRIANPEVTKSDNGNDSSMVFKMTAIDVDKSIIFLGDGFNFTSKELLEEPEKLKSYAVQMAHQEYEADSICAFEGDKVIRLTKEGYEIIEE